METSKTESSQPSSPVVSEPGTKANDELAVHSPAAATADKLDSSPSSSSSSPESPLKDPSPGAAKEPENKTPPSPATPVEVKEETELASGYSSDDHVSMISTPRLDSPDNEASISVPQTPEFSGHPNDADSSSDDEPTTVSPPTQVMERESKYRIPSSVFARSKSNAPDWSIASNESLFSIQMGNMSFIKDDIFWKSGELGLKSGELGMKSGELDMRYGEPTMRPGELNTKSGELEMKPGTKPEEPTTPAERTSSVQMFNYAEPLNTEQADLRKSVELGVAVETMKEVLRECADNQKEDKSVSGGRIIRNSDGSTSTKSFAFSAGVDKSNSLATGSVSKRDAEKSMKKVQSQSNSPQEPKSPAEATPEAPKAGWLSWFSCRPFC